MSLSNAPHNLLLCLAYRHAWTPHAGAVGVVQGARVIEWELRCDRDCGVRAFEWRDLLGVRLPGTARRYEYPREYREYTGEPQAVYIREIKRQLDAAPQQLNRMLND